MPALCQWNVWKCAQPAMQRYGLLLLSDNVHVLSEDACYISISYEMLNSERSVLKPGWNLTLS